MGTMLPLLFLACADTPDCPEGFVPGATGRCHEDTDVATGGADTATDGDTGATPDSGADTGDVDSGDPTQGTWLPPAWDDGAASFTVPADRGRAWAIDPSFRLDGFAVPHLLRTPDGGWAMLATDMRGNDRFLARSVLWSDDGATWTEGGALLRAEDFPYGCRARLEDSTSWMAAPGVWTFLFLGALEDAEGDGQEERWLCGASTSDLASFSYGEGPLFDGTFDGDLVSVPAVLAFDGEDPRLWYNGDLLGVSEEGPGIRVARIAADGAVADVSAPLLHAGNVDPAPAYVEGGGVRLYHTWSEGPDGATGVGFTDLDAALVPTGEDVAAFLSPGACGKEPLGTCYMDPAFARLDDGTLALYFGVTEYAGDGTFTTWIGRAVATD